MLGSVLLLLIRTIITVWDISTNWIYTILTRPGEKLKNYNRVLGFPESTIQENDTEVRFYIYLEKLF